MPPLARGASERTAAHSLYRRLLTRLALTRLWPHILTGKQGTERQNMRYRVQVRNADSGEWWFGPLIDGTEQQAIAAAHAFRTSESVTYVRVIQVDAESDTNGLEIWSERRDA